MAFRYDRGELRKPVKTEQGFLRVDGYVSRPGIYEYVNTPTDEKRGLGKAGTVRRELRPDDEVFRADSLAGFEDAPVTLGHPNKMVDATNARSVRVGTVKAPARRDGDRAAASMVIDDPKAIAAVETGTRQLSPGYRIDEDITSGADPKYGRYDVVQRNIRINHLALVDRARGGDDCAVRMDGEDALAVERLDVELDAKQRGNLDDSDFADPDDRKLPLNDREHVIAAMGGHGFSAVKGWASKSVEKRAFDRIVAAAKKFDIDTTNFEKQYGSRTDASGGSMADDTDDDTVDIALLKATIAKLEQQLAEMTAGRSDAAKRADSAESRTKGLEQTVDELRGQLDKAMSGAVRADSIREEESSKVKAALELLDKERADRAELERSMPERVNRRSEICRYSEAILGAGFRTDGQNNRDLMIAMIKRLRPTFDLATLKTDEQVEARFDAIMEGRIRSAMSVRAAVAGVGDRSDARVPVNRFDSPLERERRLMNLANEAGPRGELFPKEK